MDVGLITQHNLRNFGSDLQAFSLYARLNELGAKTSVINYWLPGLRRIYNSKYDWKVDGLSKLPRRILGNLARFANARNIEKSRERFAQFRSGWRLTREYVGEDAINRDPPVFDAYVAGSDAIWHPRYIVPARGLCFAKGLGKRTVAYAPSVGTSQISADEAENMRRIISGIDFLSCREKSGAERLSEILQDPVEAVLDPIFLHSPEWWKNQMDAESILKGDYIFAYLVLPDRKLARQTLRAVKKRYGLPAASIALGIADNYGLGVDKTVFDAGPREFLNLLVNAKVVVASSFHGAAFGLHFRKDVYAIKSNPFDTRIDDIFERFGLQPASIALGIADNYGLGVDKTVFDAGPREFLNLLVNAKVVVASSFHGAAFGLHFRKDVYAIKSNPFDTRIDDIFERFGLPPDRIISASNPSPASGDLDYSRADAKFAEELAKSQNYLKCALGAEPQK